MSEDHDHSLAQGRTSLKKITNSQKVVEREKDFNPRLSALGTPDDADYQCSLNDGNKRLPAVCALTVEIPSCFAFPPAFSSICIPLIDYGAAFPSDPAWIACEMCSPHFGFGDQIAEGRTDGFCPFGNHSKLSECHALLGKAQNLQSRGYIQMCISPNGLLYAVDVLKGKLVMTPTPTDPYLLLRALWPRLCWQWKNFHGDGGRKLASLKPNSPDFLTWKKRGLTLMMLDPVHFVRSSIRSGLTQRGAFFLPLHRLWNVDKELALQVMKKRNVLLQGCPRMHMEDVEDTERSMWRGKRLELLEARLEVWKARLLPPAPPESLAHRCRTKKPSKTQRELGLREGKYHRPYLKLFESSESKEGDNEGLQEDRSFSGVALQKQDDRLRALSSWDCSAGDEQLLSQGGRFIHFLPPSGNVSAICPSGASKFGEGDRVLKDAGSDSRASWGSEGASTGRENLPACISEGESSAGRREKTLSTSISVQQSRTEWKEETDKMRRREIMQDVTEGGVAFQRALSYAEKVVRKYISQEDVTAFFCLSRPTTFEEVALVSSLLGEEIG